MGGHGAAPGSFHLVGYEPLSERYRLRERADAFGASLVHVGHAKAESIAARIVEAAAAANGNWTVVVLPHAEFTKEIAVAILAEGSVDDLIALGDEHGERVLENALSFASRIADLAEVVANKGNLCGDSIAMRNVYKRAALCLVAAKLPVIILGETGTGKGRIAKALHQADSDREGKPFHTLDCGSLTDSLFGSELFGHVKGAFTGAIQNREGAFESAANGTLLLDEIGDMTRPLQSYLLNALQERAYRPVGSDRPMPVRCRVVAATNRELSRDVDEGRFRPDLFHRLNGISIRLPALRERTGDITELFRHFVTRAREDPGDIEVAPEVEEVLNAYEFPGNVRELELIANMTAARMGLETAVRLAHLPLSRMQRDFSSQLAERSVESMVRDGMGMRDIENDVARRAARTALQICGARRRGASRTVVIEDAARALGVSPRTVYNKINGAKDGN